MSQIQEIKEANDIVEVIGSRLDLKRSGANYRGLCPFHSEKSPSFFVNEVLQRFRCFGCGEAGDVYEFLQKYEGMTFYEALQHLAEKAGIQLESVARSPEDELRDQLKTVLDLSRQYFHYLLTDHETGQRARDYLKERGITKESIDLFQIGYSLPGWDGLLSYLHTKKKIPLEAIEKAGLIIRGSRASGGLQGGTAPSARHFYDRFRGRIMFPLKDHRGQVVGFSGRTMEKDVKEAKYINTPETALYHKGKMLYGYSELFNFIRQEKKLIVVEGEFDVISSVQAHVNNVVALKGSALTEDHAKLLARSVDSVILSLDTDSAGVEATKKAIAVLRPTELELRALVIGEGKDPDELARRDPKAWRETTKQSVSAYQFLINAAAQKFDPATAEGKRGIMKELGPVLASVPHAVELEFYLKELSRVLGVQKEVVRTDITRYQEKQALGLTTRTASGTPTAATATASEKALGSRRHTLEEYLLFLLFHHDAPELVAHARELRETEIELQAPGANALLDRLIEVRPPDLQTFARILPQDQQQLLFELHSHPKHIGMLENIQLDAEWKHTIQDWKTEAIRERVEKLTARLTELDAKLEKTAEEDKEQDELLRQIVRMRE